MNNAPFGLAPVRSLSGAPFNSQGEMVYIPSTDTSEYSIGDAVVSAGSADTNGVPSVAKGAASGPYRGVIVGIQPDPDNQKMIPIPATKTRDYYVWIVQDPNIVYRVQADSTVITAADIGSNANLTITNPSGIAVESGTVLDGASIATTATLAVRILGLSRIPGNVLGAYCILDVKINNSEFAAGVAGV